MAISFPVPGSLYQSQFAASRRIGEAAFSLVEKMDMALLNTTQRLLLNNLNLLGGLARARDAGMSAGGPAAFMPRAPEEWMTYQKETMQAMVDWQRECVGLLQGYAEQLRGGMASAGAPTDAAPGLTSATGQAGPVGAAARANPISGMLSLWEYSLREFTSFAQKNLTVMESSMQKAATRTAAQAEEAARMATDNVSEAVNRVAEAAAMAQPGETGGRPVQVEVPGESKGGAPGRKR